MGIRICMVLNGHVKSTSCNTRFPSPAPDSESGHEWNDPGNWVDTPDSLGQWNETIIGAVSCFTLRLHEIRLRWWFLQDLHSTRSWIEKKVGLDKVENEFKSSEHNERHIERLGSSQ